MTDIVEIARERRAMLTAEMVRLDEFIRMAEALMDIDLPDDDDGGEAPAEASFDDMDFELLLTGDQLLLTDPDAEAEAGAEAEGPEDELLLTDAVEREDRGGEGELDVHVGMRIRHRRWMMGISQEEFARQAGITVGEVQRYESGDSRVSAKRLRGIADAMKVPMSFFLEGLPDETRGAAAAKEGARTEK